MLFGRPAVGCCSIILRTALATVSGTCAARTIPSRSYSVQIKRRPTKGSRESSCLPIRRTMELACSLCATMRRLFSSSSERTSAGSAATLISNQQKHIQDYINENNTYVPYTWRISCWKALAVRSGMKIGCSTEPPSGADEPRSKDNMSLKRPHCRTRRSRYSSKYTPSTCGVCDHSVHIK